LNTFYTLLISAHVPYNIYFTLTSSSGVMTMSVVSRWSEFLLRFLTRGRDGDTVVLSWVEYWRLRVMVGVVASESESRSLSKASC